MVSVKGNKMRCFRNDSNRVADFDAKFIRLWRLFILAQRFCPAQTQLQQLNESFQNFPSDPTQSWFLDKKKNVFRCCQWMLIVIIVHSSWVGNRAMSIFCGKGKTRSSSVLVVGLLESWLHQDQEIKIAPPPPVRFIQSQTTFDGVSQSGWLVGKCKNIVEQTTTTFFNKRQWILVCIINSLTINCRLLLNFLLFSKSSAQIDLKPWKI